MTLLSVRVDDDTLERLRARADASRLSLDLLTERLLQRAAQVLPHQGERAVVVSGESLEALERILGGGSVFSGADLAKKIERLAGISFFHVRLPFTPNQLEALRDKAERQGLSVEELVNRTAPRVYEQFFDLVARV